VSAAFAAVRRLGAVAPRRALAMPGRAVLAVPARLRRRLLALAVMAGLLFALYMLVLRDVGLVAVDKVAVSGLTGKDAGRAATALEGAARESTTLHVDHAAIDDVAARFPTIESVEVEARFPKGMRLTVTEQRPAAMLVVGARRIPVAGDGSVLTGLPVKASLPEVKIEAGEVPSKQLTPGGTLEAVRVAGGAPAALTPTLQDVARRGAKGWVVQIEDGPLLIFGPAAEVAEKWAAATRVLADRDAAGADYIDLRIPGRPAAGGLGVQTMEPVAPAGSEDGATPALPGQNAGARPALPSQRGGATPPLPGQGAGATPPLPGQGSTSPSAPAEGQQP